MPLVYERTSTRTMDPRPGVKFSTTYNRITASTRRRMARDIQAVINEILAQCEYENDYSIANPLRDFSRTGGKENYSAGDIMVDLKRQLEDGKDIPDAMVDRWNRLFREWPEIQIEFRDSAEARTNFNQLFR